MSSPLVLTTAEVADLLRLSEWTVRSMVRAGALPHIQGVRKLRIPAAAVFALIGEGYDAGRGESNGQASAKKATSWRRNRGAAQGSVAKTPVGSSDSLARPIGPAKEDVVVRVVEGRSR